ncbi:MAG: hypothetical protein ACJAW4_001685 [Paracoccaceae bacterium]|jgi:hypothetical protein
MTISQDLLDERLKGCELPEDLLGDAGLMKELKIKLMERMLGAELTTHPLPGSALWSNVPRGWATRKVPMRPRVSRTGATAPAANA